MPNTPIPQSQVPLTGLDTNMTTVPWYRFFYDLYVAASGSVGPPVDGAVLEHFAEMTKALQGLSVLPPTLDTSALTQAFQGLSVAPPVLDTASLSQAVQDLQLAPPIIPMTTAMTNSATLDFGNTVAGACTDLTITVMGAVSGDVVALGVPSASVPANGSFSAWVSAADTVTVRYTNNDLVTAYNPASGSFRVTVTRN